MLDAEVLELHRHRRSGVHLQGDHALASRVPLVVVDRLRHHHAVDLQRDLCSPGDNHVIVPIVGLLIGESPEQAADTPVWLALSNAAKGINGEYVHHREIKKSWPPTRDEDAQTRLFNVTQSMLGEWL